MVNIMNRAGFNAMSSKNLSAIMRYHRTVSPIVYIRIIQYENGRGCELFVLYLNGSKCEEDFASYEVCKKWVARKRSLKNAVVYHVTSELHKIRDAYDYEDDMIRANLDFSYKNSM